MWKKTKKNKIPNPPSHLPGFRALLPLAGAIVEGLELVFTDSVLLEEFWPSVVEGDVDSGSELVDVGLVGVVVEGLTRVVLEVAALVVGIVVEGLTRVVLEVAALEVVGIVVKGLELVSRVGSSEVFDVMDIDMVAVPLHNLACSSQMSPGSQHPSGPHLGHPNLHGSEQ